MNVDFKCAIVFTLSLLGFSSPGIAQDKGYIYFFPPERSQGTVITDHYEYSEIHPGVYQHYEKSRNRLNFSCQALITDDDINMPTVLAQSEPEILTLPSLGVNEVEFVNFGFAESDEDQEGFLLLQGREGGRILFAVQYVDPITNVVSIAISEILPRSLRKRDGSSIAEVLLLFNEGPRSIAGFDNVGQLSLGCTRLTN